MYLYGHSGHRDDTGMHTRTLNISSAVQAPSKLTPLTLPPVELGIMQASDDMGLETPGKWAAILEKQVEKLG